MDNRPHGVATFTRSVSIAVAARLLDVSRRTIYARIKSGELRTIRTLGGSQRVLVASLVRSETFGAPAPKGVAAARQQRASAPNGAGSGWPIEAAARLRWIAVLLIAAGAVAVPGTADAQGRRHARLSADLSRAIERGSMEATTVILTATQERVEAVAARHRLRIRKRLRTGAVLEVPAGRLASLADDAGVDQLSGDIPVRAQMAVAAAAIGADQVLAGGWRAGMPALTGKGVGVAVIDSGIANVPELKGRIVVNVDFTGAARSAREQATDQYGHGTHVAGIIAAALDARRGSGGVAPGAHLVNLKVLDENGAGTAAGVIDALDWTVENQHKFQIRVINLSLGGAVLQPWRDDPLSHAVERAHRAGLVVVVSAGNLGRLADGRTVIGGVTAPGNSPFALTVGAINANETPWRSDDQVAAYSSRGPTRFDRLVKPDLVAPGSRIASLLAPGSTLARKHPERVLDTRTGRRLILSGTSMAAAVASGAAAQIVAAYPSISPVGVRFRMQYTASRTAGVPVIAAGAGSLNLLSAVLMGRTRGVPVTIAGEQMEDGHLVFGHRQVLNDISRRALNNRVLRGRLLSALGGEGIIWAEDDGIIWAEDDGIIWAEDDGIIWAEGSLRAEADGIIWAESDGIIWAEDDGIIWAEDDGIIWAEDDGILWGEAIVWAEDDGILWGESDGIIWAEAD